MAGRDTVCHKRGKQPEEGKPRAANRGCSGFAHRFGTLRRRATAYGRCVALGTIASWGGTIGHRTDPLVLCFPDMVYATTPKVELSARTRGFSRGIGAVCLDG